MRNSNTSLANGVIGRFGLTTGDVFRALAFHANCLKRHTRLALGSLTGFLVPQGMMHQQPLAPVVASNGTPEHRSMWNGSFTVNLGRIVAEQRYLGKTGNGQDQPVS